MFPPLGWTPVGLVGTTGELFYLSKRQLCLVVGYLLTKADYLYLFVRSL